MSLLSTLAPGVRPAVSSAPTRAPGPQDDEFTESAPSLRGSAFDDDITFSPPAETAQSLSQGKEIAPSTARTKAAPSKSTENETRAEEGAKSEGGSLLGYLGKASLFTLKLTTLVAVKAIDYAGRTAGFAVGAFVAVVFDEKRAMRLGANVFSSPGRLLNAIRLRVGLGFGAKKGSEPEIRSLKEEMAAVRGELEELQDTLGQK